MGRVFQENLFCETVFGGLQVARNALQETQALMGASRVGAFFSSLVSRSGFLLNKGSHLTSSMRHPNQS